MDGRNPKPTSRFGLYALVGVLGVAVVAAALLFRTSPPAPPPPTPVPLVPPRNLARIADEGSLTRKSPEEEFLAAAARMNPKAPLTLDSAAVEKESRRTYAALRGLFQKMKVLADTYKKSNPARYAVEIEALKEDLAQWMQAARGLLKDSDVAVDELFKSIREEGDATVKERMGFLIRYADPKKTTPQVVALSQSQDAGDRKAAIGALIELRSRDSVDALVARAAADPEMDLRERSIVALGKTLSKPGRSVEDYQDTAIDAIRSYTRPEMPVPLRSAAWDAFSFPPRLSEQDEALIRSALQQEKDSFVLKSVESAYRHQAARSKAANDRRGK